MKIITFFYVTVVLDKVSGGEAVFFMLRLSEKLGLAVLFSLTGCCSIVYQHRSFFLKSHGMRRPVALLF